MGEIASESLSIGDGGITFSVVDEGRGPTIRIKSSHFGNNVHTQDIFVRESDLPVLAQMFWKASQHTQYTKEYCHPATKYDASCRCGSQQAQQSRPPDDDLSVHQYFGEANFNIGFPADDENSLQQGSPGSDCNLDFWYTHQFCQGEVTSTDPGGLNHKAIYAPLAHTPLLPEYTTGTVYHDVNGVWHAIQTFVASKSGLTFTDLVDSPARCVREGSTIDKNGTITMQWSGAVGRNYLVLDYEYDCNGNDYKPFDLNPYSAFQYVQNEVSTTDQGGTNHIALYLPLEHTPILPGSLIGTVYRGSCAIQTFKVDHQGVFSFEDLGQQDVKCIPQGSSINWTTGELLMKWSGQVGSNHMVMSYEYEIV